MSVLQEGDECSLLNKKVRIRMYSPEYESYLRLGKKMPELPTLYGVVTQKIFFGDAGYCAKLDSLLNLNVAGLSQVISCKNVSLVYFHCPATDIYEGKDPYLSELMGHANRLKTKEGELSSIIRSVSTPNQIPHVVFKDDPFLEKSPVISWGFVSLV